MAITRTDIGPQYIAPQPTITAGPVKRVLSPPTVTPRTAVPRSSIPSGAPQPPGLIDVGGGGYNPDPSVNPQNGAATSDQGNSGADAQALTGLLSLYQSAFGNGGQGGGGASAPGTLIASPATDSSMTDQSTPTTSASLNLTTVVLAGIVIGAAYLVYRHFKSKGKTIARAAGAA
jgi:hypothetical protein